MKTLYEVEWCVNVPVDESGDLSIDEAEYKTRYVTSIEDARKLAAEVFPLDVFGSVAITECHFEPYEPGSKETYIEYDSEPEYYDGPE